MVEIHNKKLCESCFSETESDICPHCGFSKKEYTADLMVLPAGTRLKDKILIGRVMGKGGFGITYLGYDVRMEKVIAVKEYYPNGIAYRSNNGTDILITDEKSKEAFEKGAEKFYSEAEMVTQFNGNPNIVSVYDYFRANNTVYLVMEYLNGITLKKYIRKHGKISDGQALFIMDKMAAALSITHSAGVLHRDISPDNIMLCMDGKVKLIDFGAARQIMAESSSNNLTVVMKPGYTPIEQYTKKGRQGAWTDIYALGASIYYALTEFVIDDPYNRMDGDEEFSENRHGINSDLWDIIKKCTMIQPSERYGNAIYLRQDLSAVTAPVKPEPVVLKKSDVKTDEPEAENYESITPLISVPESIEVFTDGRDEISVTENGSEGNLPADAYESGSKKNPVSKKRMTALICAATVVIIGITGIAIAANRRDNIAVDNYEGSVNRQDNTPAYTEDPVNHQNIIADAPETSGQSYGSDDESAAYMLIDKNDDRWSMTKNISIFTLRKFEGDILVTLNILTNDDIKNEDGSYYHSVSVIDNNENSVRINAFNWLENPDGYYVYDGQKQFTFVLPESSISEIYQYIGFEANGLTINSVELRPYSSPAPDAKTIQFDGTYPGDWQLLNGAIPKSDLEGFGGDVMVTLDIETGIYNDDEEWLWHIDAMKELDEWRRVDITVFNHVLLKPEYMYSVYDGQNQFTFIISRKAIEELPDSGLKIQVHNVIVRTALIEPSKITEKE